jgi:hypothetical protein
MHTPIEQQTIKTIDTMIVMILAVPQPATIPHTPMITRDAKRFFM